MDAEDRAVIEFSADLSYYHGVEGGESWSEGSRQDSVLFKLEEPGEYRLLLFAQHGSGETASSATAQVARPRLTIRLSEGVVLSRFYLAFACLCLLWFGVEVGRASAFERARWEA